MKARGPECGTRGAGRLAEVPCAQRVAVANERQQTEPSPPRASSFPLHAFRPAPPRNGAYILFELVIALTIFAIAVLGLARSLNESLNVANQLNREHAIRIGLRSFLEEARKKPVADMAMTGEDTRLGCTFASTIEPLGLQNREGRNLTGLYKLDAKAAYTDGSEMREESVFVYVYEQQPSR